MHSIARRLVLVSLCLSSLAPWSPHARAAARPRAWRPERTWVVVVGALDFRDRESFEPFPKARRRDAALVRLLERRGVPEDHVAYLRDEGVTVRAVGRAVAAAAASAEPGDWLFVYYTGHGWVDDETGETYFATYDAVEPVKGVAMRSVVSTVAREFGGRALLFADCCDSGALADAVRASRSGAALACLASSQAVEASTGDWTFTDCLLDALAGEGYLDLDGDGAITLGELASDAAEEMAVGEEQLVSFATTPGFGPETELAVARSRRTGRVGERGEVDDDDGDPYRARVVAERDGELKVHEIGDDDRDDVWVDADALRPYRPARYAVGTAVEAESEGDWYAARVIDARRGVHRVHYDGYEADTDEWVSSDRIRLRRRGRR